MKLKSIAIVFFFLFSTAGFSQIKSFGKEPEVFIKELEKLMTADNNPKAVEAFTQFKLVWDTKVFDDYQTSRIIKNADKMLLKRLKPSPHFDSYLNTLRAFSASGKMKDQFVMWQKIFETYYEKPSKDLSAFLDLSEALFKDNIFVTTTGVRSWKSSNDAYVFDLQGGEPFVLVESLDIFCVTRGDSLAIYKTKGKLAVNTLLWEGTGGRINWTRGNIPADKVYADLKKYSIDMNGNEYKADSVTFVHNGFFSAPLGGRIEDKALTVVNEERTAYPKFFSYKKDLKIDKFAKDVDYKGGFSMQGNKVVAYDGVFSFFYKSKPFFQARGKEFVVTDDRIITDKAAININLDTSSISHPQVDFNYVIKDRLITATRGDEGITRAPFLDLYHNLEIKADKITWKIDDPKIEMRNILKDKSVLLYSKNYFAEFDYEKIQALMDYNPLAKIKQFCEKTGKTTFTLDEYCKFLNNKKENVRFGIIQLNDQGYLVYNVETEEIKANEKLFNSVNAHLGRTDYDIITFESIIEKKPNISINLENLNMELEGVGRFRFSDSQTVAVTPTDQKVLVKKDRDLEFDGRVQAGRFEFFGSKFKFNYQQFKIDLEKIDSLRLYFPDENNNLKRVNSVLQDITGTVYIDQQFNKSGRKPFPEYPIFKATKRSKVYYDRPTTYGGVYDRERFFFDLDPFVIDSLDNFTKEGLTFDGNFESADIFPDFRETLTLQPDFSLGFTKTLNMPAYKATGNANVFISLSNEGLLGSGEVDYATSVTKSTKFEFFPDSMNAMSTSFDLSSNALYPEVHGKNVRTHWMPYDDKMSQFSQEEPFSIFGDSKLTGEFVLSRKGSGGNGNLEFNEAEIVSTNMKFEPKRMRADTSTLKIKSLDPTKLAFRSDNVKSDVNFATRIGDFKSNVDGANSEFPYNQYKGSLNEFKWDIAKKTIKFITPPSKPIEKTYFVSVHPDQDSLQFSSREAVYDLNDYTLYANKVPHIDVADSRVLPDSGKVVVRKDAVMDVLKNAKITIDTLNKYHTLYKCEVGIFGKYNMGADGYYDYIDKTKKKNTVRIHEVKVDYLSKTVIAKGNVYDTMHFTIGPKFEFKGELFITGKNKGLLFDGHVHPVQAMGRPSSGWFRDKGIYSADSVIFRINKPINEDKKPLKVGFAVTLDSTHTYPAFFTLGRNYADSALVEVEQGVLFYDETSQKFFAGDAEKIAGRSPKGNYVYLDEKNKILYGEGNAQLGANLGAFGLKTAGNATYFQKDSSIDLNLMMLMDFPLPEEALKTMTDKMIEASLGLNATNNSRDMVQKALAELLTEKDYENVKKDLQEGGNISLVQDLAKTIFISEVRFRWSQKRKAFVSEGNIGITSFGKIKFEKRVEGRIEVKRKRSGDEITFYFQADKDNWYYINFTRKNMYIFSSNDLFNNIIRENYAKVSTDNYYLKLASPRAKQKFLNSFDGQEQEVPDEQEEQEPEK